MLPARKPCSKPEVSEGTSYLLWLTRGLPSRISKLASKPEAGASPLPVSEVTPLLLCSSRLGLSLPVRIFDFHFPGLRVP